MSDKEITLEDIHRELVVNNKMLDASNKLILATFICKEARIVPETHTSQDYEEFWRCRVAIRKLIKEVSEQYDIEVL